jgi:hypothetical protein
MKRPSWLRFPRIPRPDVDVRDVHVYIGLALATWGAAQLSRPWATIGLGVALALLGVFLPRILPRKGP